MHRWNRENPGRARATRQRKYKRHREEILAANSRWAKENPGKVNAINRRWRERNPEQMEACRHQWERDNPDKVREKKNRRRARKANAKGCASAEQIVARIEYYGGLCYLCGKPYEAVDHVIPLSRGGSGWPVNQRPICKSCNSRKGNKLLAAC